jgi:hypothetical protein
LVARLGSSRRLLCATPVAVSDDRASQVINKEAPTEDLQRRPQVDPPRAGFVIHWAA